MFDKWPVYLAFAVNEAGCDDVRPQPPTPPLPLFPSPSLSLRPFLRGQTFWPECPTRSKGAIGRTLPKGGTARSVLMAFTAGSPLSPLYHQVSANIKKTHLPLGCSHISPPPKEIRDSWLLVKLLAITLLPLLYSFPSMFAEFCMCSDSCRGFLGNLRN